MDYREQAARALALDAISGWPRHCNISLYQPMTSSHRTVFRVIDEDGREQGLATVTLEPEVQVKTLAFRAQGYEPCRALNARP